MNMDVKSQEWRPVDGYPGYYVHLSGRVFFCGGVRRIKVGFRNNIQLSHGYVVVSIRNKRRTLHRVVAEAFIPNPLKKKTVNHKDGNKANNHVDNLEWATQSENVIHAYKVLGRETPTGRLGLWGKKVIQMNLQGEIIKIHKNVMLASKELGISDDSIRNACYGTSKTSGGFKWRYK